MAKDQAGNRDEFSMQWSWPRGPNRELQRLSPQKAAAKIRSLSLQVLTFVRLAWNIESGNRFEGIVDALKNHARLKEKDVLLLTELDYGMARSGNRFVAQELAAN